MITRLKPEDIIINIPEQVFLEPGNGSISDHPDYFLFHDKALQQIRMALQNEGIYRHLIITGEEGIGKRSGILNLLHSEFSKSSLPEKYYYSPEKNTILYNPSIQDGLIPLYNPDQKETPIAYEPYPSILGLYGIFTQSHYYPGSLVKTAGGFLILPMSRLVEEPGIYEVLKISLYRRSLDFVNLPETVHFQGLDRRIPPIPVRVRVILIGEDYHYDLLLKKDPNLHDAFKFKIELEPDAELNKRNMQRFSLLINRWGQDHLPKASPEAKIVLLKTLLWVNDSRSKFLLNLSKVRSILEECYAMFPKKKELSGDDITKAADNLSERNSILKRSYIDDIRRGFYNLDLKGKRIGRINGLSVLINSDNSIVYGQVNVISARAVLGSGTFINIEREVNLSGNIHDKGVFVLQSYIKGFFSHLNSFGFDASIMFEQNNFVIDGDSASAGELLAIFSALSELPIPSNVAVTGSVTQYGDILPVGAINQKISTWFEICRDFGSQRIKYSVYIPKGNEKDLLLSEEIKNAVKKSKFEIISFSHIDELASELMQVPIGKIEKDGKYTNGSLLRIIEDRLERKKEIDKI